MGVIIRTKRTIMGTINLINEDDVFDYIDGFIGSATEQVVEMFSFAGTKFQEHARLNAAFIDHTKNLRNSIGYTVAVKGKVVKESYGQIIEDGVNENAETEAIKNDIIRGENSDVVLLGIAGMSYGVYVENMKGKSVISQSIPVVEQLLTRLTGSL